MIVALNNKSNLNNQEFMAYQERLCRINCKYTLILCPTLLNIANFNLPNIFLGSQNVSKDLGGAHTGEVAAEHLKSYNVKYCLVGHSERRQTQNETNEEIAKKIKHLFVEKITPILCVGETHEQRKLGETNKIISEELMTAIMDLTEKEKEKLIVAYEPIWSIGTGVIPTNEEITEAFKTIKNILPNTKVLYGGSANEQNILKLKECSLIDGYLVGGLSLKPELLEIFLEKLEN